MYIYWLFWEFHLYSIADTLGFLSVNSRVSSRECLYSITCYFVTSTHYLLAQIYGWYIELFVFGLAFFFVFLYVIS